MTLQGLLATPELTTNGAYAKAWRRYPDGTLWLHKRGTTDDYESRVEVCVSNILNKTNVLHCHYEMTTDDGVPVCACPAMTSDILSILPGFDFYSYCNRFGFNMDQKLIALDKEQYYKQMIVDYLIANRDRHGQNWGVYYDPSDMHFVSMHPLFDHNNAFSDEWMDDPDAIYQFNGKSIRESAHYAVKRCNFKFTSIPVVTDFPNQKAYDIFMIRARELNLL